MPVTSTTTTKRTRTYFIPASSLEMPCWDNFAVCTLCLHYFFYRWREGRNYRQATRGCILNVTSIVSRSSLLSHSTRHRSAQNIQMLIPWFRLWKASQFDWANADKLSSEVTSTCTSGACFSLRSWNCAARLLHSKSWLWKLRAGGIGAYDAASYPDNWWPTILISFWLAVCFFLRLIGQIVL